MKALTFSGSEVHKLLHFQRFSVAMEIAAVNKKATSWAAPVTNTAEKVFTGREVGNVKFMDTCCH